jgi:hypothetical protein
MEGVEVRDVCGQLDWVGNTTAAREGTGAETVDTECAGEPSRRQVMQEYLMRQLEGQRWTKAAQLGK